jgi:hypothetical protein
MLFLVILLWSLCMEAFGKPLLIVHIGPSKTASTTIQNSISQNMKKVKAAGWLPLGSENGGGVIHGRLDVDRAFRDFNQKKSGNFFQTALEGNQNVIVSCEYLGSAEALSMDLYNEVLEAFDTTVVMFYRDFLSIQISLHYQRRSLDSLTDFLTNPAELHSSPVVIGVGGYFERMEAWNRFEKMTILDFNGMVAKGVSFQYVFFCEILHIREICDDEEYKVNHISNPTTDSRIDDVRKSRVADLFHSFAFSRGCKCDFEAFKKDIDLSFVPMHKQDLSHLVLYSKLLDQEFRRKYKVTMYSDPEATVRAIENHLDYEDVDTQRILLDEAWHRKFEDALKSQVASGSAKCDIHSKHKQDPASGLVKVDRHLRGI